MEQAGARVRKRWSGRTRLTKWDQLVPGWQNCDRFCDKQGWQNETSWCKSDKLLSDLTRLTKCDQLVQVWQNCEWFCHYVDKIGLAGGIMTKLWSVGTKLTKLSQLVPVWQHCDWMWPIVHSKIPIPISRDFEILNTNRRLGWEILGFKIRNPFGILLIYNQIE
jgi:hypothetical protein